MLNPHTQGMTIKLKVQPKPSTSLARGFGPDSPPPQPPPTDGSPDTHSIPPPPSSADATAAAAAGAPPVGGSTTGTVADLLSCSSCLLPLPTLVGAHGYCELSQQDLARLQGHSYLRGLLGGTQLVLLQKVLAAGEQVEKGAEGQGPAVVSEPGGMQAKQQQPEGQGGEEGQQQMAHAGSSSRSASRSRSASPTPSHSRSLKSQPSSAVRPHSRTRCVAALLGY